MAKYAIKHICGHTQVHQIYGTNAHGERDRKQAWLATCLCDDCYKAQQQAERDAKNAESAKANAEAHLPTLTGTPKQIAWAETIRAEKIKKLNEILASIEALKAKRALSEIEVEQDKKVQAFATAYKNEDSAARWIDLRDRSVESLLNECIK